MRQVLSYEFRRSGMLEARFHHGDKLREGKLVDAANIREEYDSFIWHKLQRRFGHVYRASPQELVKEVTKYNLIILIKET